MRELAPSKQADRVEDALAANASQAKSKRREELLRRVRLATTQGAERVANDIHPGNAESPPPPPPSKRQ